MPGIPFVNDADLRGNQLVDFRIEHLNGLPSATADMDGRIVYNTQDNRYYVCAATAWWKIPKDLDSLEGVTAAYLRNRANHTGQQDSSTISDFHAAVIASRLDEFAAPNGPVTLAGQKLTNVGAGSSSTDAVNKQQLDAVAAIANAAASGIAIKNAVRAVAKTNVTLSGTQTVDGVALAAGDRVLVAGQTNAANNGIYVVASATWVRSTDADEDGELAPGTLVAVREGTSEADSLWGLVSDQQIVIGTTDQTWSRMIAGSQGEVITAGNGITKSGTTISVQPKSGSGITVDGSGVGLDDTKVSKFASGTVPSGSTSATLTHNLGQTGVDVTIIETSTGLRVMVPVSTSGPNAVVATFKSAPTTNQYSWQARR
ncbi:tail fiber protein [Gordonia phage Clawz]|uniref:Trimeric autotransporter adhesin YadA-like stalk domain-containing protein n=1 Tax=Gordonia phage Clawz TaxID=2743910 RepID=A0AAE7F839_9CAUD|nr:tail fiber protein [Gordonia phage Clawz]QKY79981.1 hypothetical protein SEA_CLAWZ_69 [Gordonia phage Clawz]